MIIPIPRLQNLADLEEFLASLPEKDYSFPNNNILFKQLIEFFQELRNSCLKAGTDFQNEVKKILNEPENDLGNRLKEIITDPIEATPWMMNPVLDPHGHTFNESALLDWLSQPGVPKCPLSRTPISANQLIKNIPAQELIAIIFAESKSLRDQFQEELKLNPAYKDGDDAVQLVELASHTKNLDLAINTISQLPRGFMSLVETSAEKIPLYEFILDLFAERLIRIREKKSLADIAPDMNDLLKKILALKDSEGNTLAYYLQQEMRLAQYFFLNNNPDLILLFSIIDEIDFAHVPGRGGNLIQEILSSYSDLLHYALEQSSDRIGFARLITQLIDEGAIYKPNAHGEIPLQMAERTESRFQSFYLEKTLGYVQRLIDSTPENYQQNLQEYGHLLLVMSIQAKRCFFHDAISHALDELVLSAIDLIKNQQPYLLNASLSLKSGDTAAILAVRHRRYVVFSRLQDEGIDLSEKNLAGEDVIDAALQNGSLENFLPYFARDKYLRFQDSDGNTLLMNAIKHQQEKRIRALLHLPTHFSDKNNLGQTVLHLAIMHKTFAFILEMQQRKKIKPADWLIADNAGNYPAYYLHDPSLKAEETETFTQLVRFLNEQGLLETRPLSIRGESIWHCLARDGNLIEAACIAPEPSLYVMSFDAHGNTPLHTAVIYGNFLLFNYFLSSFSCPNLPNMQGDTPLHLAVKNRNVLIHPLLHIYKADALILDRENNTALHLSLLLRNSEAFFIISDFLKQNAPEQFKELLEQPNAAGQTPARLIKILFMEFLSINDLPAILKFVKNNVIDITAPINDEGDPLGHIFYKRGNYQELKELIQLYSYPIIFLAKNLAGLRLLDVVTQGIQQDFQQGNIDHVRQLLDLSFITPDDFIKPKGDLIAHLFYQHGHYDQITDLVNGFPRDRIFQGKNSSGLCLTDFIAQDVYNAAEKGDVSRLQQFLDLSFIAVSDLITYQTTLLDVLLENTHYKALATILHTYGGFGVIRKKLNRHVEWDAYENHFNSVVDKLNLKLISVNDVITESGETLLHILAKAGHCEHVVVLIERFNASLIEDASGKTPESILRETLFLAVQNGNNNCIEEFIKCQIFTKLHLLIDEEGKNLLQVAIMHGQFKTAHLLLQNKESIGQTIDLDFTQSDTLTPREFLKSYLKTHVSQAIEPEILVNIKFILTNILRDPNIIFESKNSFLHLLALHNQMALLQFLLTEKFPTALAMDRSNDESDTPLHVAIKQKHFAFAALLINSTADLKDSAIILQAKNISGLTAFELGAQIYSPLEMLQLVINHCMNLYAFQSILEICKRSNVDLNPPLDVTHSVWEYPLFLYFKDFEKYEPAHIFTCLNLLLTFNTNINLQNKNGESALHLAASSTHINAYQFCEFLLTHGADPNRPKQAGMRPLQLASAPKIFMLLFEYGANPHLIPKDVVTAKEFAEVFKHFMNGKVATLFNYLLADQIDNAKQLLAKYPYLSKNILSTFNGMMSLKLQMEEKDALKIMDLFFQHMMIDDEYVAWQSNKMIILTDLGHSLISRDVRESLNPMQLEIFRLLCRHGGDNFISHKYKHTLSLTNDAVAHISTHLSDNPEMPLTHHEFLKLLDAYDHAQIKEEDKLGQTFLRIVVRIIDETNKQVPSPDQVAKRNKYYKTALNLIIHNAARIVFSQEPTSVFFMLKGRLEHLINSCSVSPLDPQEVENILNLFSDINMPLDNQRNSLLHMAAKSKGFSFMNFLIEKYKNKLNFNALNNLGQTPLHLISEDSRFFYRLTPLTDLTIKDVNQKTALKVIFEKYGWEFFSRVLQAYTFTADVLSKIKTEMREWRFQNADGSESPLLHRIIDAIKTWPQSLPEPQNSFSYLIKFLGADLLNVTDSQGRLPLHLASFYHNEFLIHHILIHQNAKEPRPLMLNAVDNEGNTPLLHLLLGYSKAAHLFRFIHSYDQLITPENANLANRSGLTPLALCGSLLPVFHNDAYFSAFIQNLLLRGINPSHIPALENITQNFSIERNKAIEFQLTESLFNALELIRVTPYLFNLERLNGSFKYGPDQRNKFIRGMINGPLLNAKFYGANTLAHWAALNNQWEILGELAEKNADFLCRNSDGDAPLHLAVQRGNGRCVEILLSSPTAVKQTQVPNAARLTALDCSVKTKFLEQTKLLFMFHISAKLAKEGDSDARPFQREKEAQGNLEKELQILAADIFYSCGLSRPVHIPSLKASLEALLLSISSELKKWNPQFVPEHSAIISFFSAPAKIPPLVTARVADSLVKLANFSRRPEDIPESLDKCVEILAVYAIVQKYYDRQQLLKPLADIYNSHQEAPLVNVSLK